MPGPTMAYSCGYWRHATDLARAREPKHDLISRKFQLNERDRVRSRAVAGAFARYAARKCGSLPALRPQ
jgi:cyclopropane-fatty-acyl-phospholipid synthase